MLFLSRAAAFALALAAAGAPAAGQPTSAQRPSAECSDDRGVDRCAPEQHRRVLELYGLQPIEAHARAGDQMRRIFYVDGYGRDVVAIAMVRTPGRDPTLFVHFPKPAGAAARPALTALVPGSVWAAALGRSSHFERELRPAASPSEAMAMCLHSWVYTVEAVDPPRREGGRAMTRRKVEDACQDGLAEVFANELAALALPLLPYCEALDPDLHRNDASRLGACSSLEGDRQAAARAHNLAMRLGHLNGPEDNGRAQEQFEYNARIDWADQATANRRAAEEWIARTTGPAGASFYFSRAVGETSEQARIEGELIRSAGDDNNPTDLRAPVTLFVRGTGGRRPQIERGTIGAFAPHTP